VTQHDKPDEIELFLQGEGIREITLVRIPRDGTVRDVIAVARTHGLSAPAEEDVSVLLEDADAPLGPDTPLTAAGIGRHSRVHLHRCRKVAVTVNFNADHKTESFSPSATVARVKKWAVSKRGFSLSDVDATEHLLQVCGSTNRPDEDVHIGTLVQAPACVVCFDLVPKQRVEG
jgi:hypothetical protein